MPLNAAKVGAYPAFLLSGPVEPTADDDNMMMSGFTSRRSSYPSPMRPSTPGRMFSTTTSLLATRRRAMSRASSVRRFKVSDSLSRFRSLKNGDSSTLP
jgi:hypothetical protein